MNARNLFEYLGHSPAHPPFDKWLDDQRIYDRPHTAEQDDLWEEDEYEAEQSARASEIEEVERHSLCLIYDERSIYELLWGAPKSEGDFVLRQFALYAPGVQDYSGFEGELPLGLRFDMSHHQVHEMLGQKPFATRQIHDMLADLFVSEKMHVNVTYEGTGQSIAIVHVRLPHCYDLRMLGLQQVPTVAANSLVMDQLAQCLGHSAYDQQLDALLRPLGWHAGDQEMANCDEVTDLMARTGVTLYYRDAQEVAQLSGKPSANTTKIFTGFRVNRKADMYSQGFQGKLPLGLEFHQTPEQIVALVGRPPDWESVGEDTGAYKWRLPHFNLHVLFSLIDYQLYRVSCFAKFMDKEHFE